MLLTSGLIFIFLTLVFIFNFLFLLTLATILTKRSHLLLVVTLESRYPVIHQSMPTHNPRTGLFSVHFLESSHCDCKQWYHGEHDRLVRTSPALSKSRSSVHFVSVDLLNEYMTSLFGKSQEGKSIDAFVNNKNILNCDERGEAGEISKKVFLKAFEIYIHATHYNTEEAFGCNQCPGELEKGEQEDDFENKREVHICDGIDMGNMQYATHTYCDEDNLDYNDYDDSLDTPLMRISIICK